MNRPVIKFLSARTGKYEFATVDGLGDIALLQTRIKTDIVSAINELIVEGIAGGLTEEDRDRINDIGNSVDSLKNGTFQITEWGSVDEYYQDKLNATIEIINRSNKETIELEKEQVREIIETAISDYEQNVADINVLMESARQNVSNAEDLLAQKAAELETANIDYRELTQVVDVINGVIQDKVQTIDFDLFNAMTTDYQTLVTQTAQKWGVEASLDSLSYMSGRVESNQASLEVQNNMIQGKVGYNEWQYLPVNIGEYNDNLLKYTRDLTEGWERSNTAIYVTSETFQHTKIAAIEQNGAFYHTSNSDDLEVGRTYVASIWVNIQERNKNATDAKYAPNNTIHEVNLMLGTESNVTEIHEDLRGVNGWAQHYVTFVADESNPRFAPIVKFNHNTQIAYITAPKLEEGLTVTGWQPHVDDDYATIYSSHSLIRQQGNEIATFVNEVKVLEDSYQEATSSFSQIADGFELNTRKIEEYEEAVLEYGSQVKAFNDSFSAKVWESDFQNAVSDINIDNRNRVFNSAFDIIDYNETTRETDIVFWDGNDGKITELIGEHGTKENHLQLSRTGVQNVNITSMTSNKFKSRYGERLIFSFNSIISGLDADNIFALEIFDISDVRLFKKEFSLTELTAEPLANGVVRYSGSYTIAHEDTAKARVVIQLPKNGNININKLLVQGADIGTTDWTPAPEDSQLVRSRQEAEISILKDEIGLRVTKESIDQSSGLVINEEGNITINPATIIQRVTNVELLGDEALIDGTIFDQKVDGWRQRLVEDGTVINDINASPGLYQINFDRVAIDGELLARMISTYDLDIAHGFRLVNGNIPIISANAVTGEIEMNVSKLSINSLTNIRTVDGETPAAATSVELINTWIEQDAESVAIGAVGRELRSSKDNPNGEFSEVWSEIKVAKDNFELAVSKDGVIQSINGSAEGLKIDFEKVNITGQLLAAIISSEKIDVTDNFGIYYQDKLVFGVDAPTQTIHINSNNIMVNGKRVAIIDDVLTVDGKVIDLTGRVDGHDIRLTNVDKEVDAAIAEAKAAKLAAEKAYEDAIEEAEAKVQAKDKEYKLIFEEYDSTVEAIEADTQTAKTKAEQALTDVGISTDLAQTAKDLASTAQTNSGNAITQAGEALSQVVLNKGLVETANSLANEAKSQASAAISQVELNKDLVTEAKTQSDQAVVKSQEASTKAQTAIDDAKTALSTAKSADTKSGLAETAANTAKTNAQTALDDAKTALSTAKNADTKSGLAETAANTAKTNAQTALDNSSTAITNAADAITKAGQADTTANTAKTNAQTALDNAQSALTTAGSADSKAGQAIEKANAIPATITDIIADKDLVNGSYVGTKIDAATGAWSQELVRVEGVIDGIEIGGRNYFIDRLMLDIDNYEHIGSYHYYTIDNLSPEEVYTVSVRENFTNDITIGSGANRALRINNDKTGSLGVDIIDVRASHGVKTYEREIRANEDGQLFIISYVPSLLDEISNMIQIEKGNKATDWSPAPEDLYSQEEFKLFNAQYSQDVTGITGRLTTVESDKLDGSTFQTFKQAEYQVTADKVASTITRVDTAEEKITTQGTAITQQAGLIESKAEKTVVDNLGKTVSSQGTSISQNATDIASKASSSSVDSLTGRVKTAETSITQNATDIESKASQTEVDTVKGTVSTHTTTIGQHATAIASKAEKSVVDTLSGTVSNQGTLITQNATDISSKAEKELVDTIKGTVDTHTTEISQNATDIASKASSTSVSSLTGRVKTAETTITQHATAITSKANQTEVDTVKGTVSGHTTTLSQHAKAISSKAESELVDTIKGTVDTHTTEISQNATDIASKANSATVNTLTGRVDTAESNISQNATAITQRVTTNTYNTGIASKENTVLKQSTAPTHVNGRLWLDTSVTPNILKRSNGTTWIKATPTTPGEVGAYSQAAGAGLAGRLTTAETNITQTATAITSKADKSTVDTLAGTVSTQGTTITQQATLIASKANQTEVDTVKGTVSGHTTTISQHATAIASKAESSLVNTIKSTVDTHTTDIRQNATDITSKASSSSVNTLTGRVNTAESNITQNATAITQRVTTTTYNAGIGSKENSVLKQSAAPTHLNGRLWLDTSVTPNVLKRSTGSAWVKATPTTASEVGAYSSGQGSALAGRVTTAETNITQTSTAITSKADKSVVDTLSGTVSTHGTTLTQHATAISSKAAQTEVDTVKGTVSGHTTTISQHATKIASKAESSLVNTIKGTVDTHTTEISQNATAIKSKASSSSVSTLTGRVSTAETTITQHGTAITSKASQTEVDTVKGTVSGHTSTLSQHATAISARLTSSQVNSLVDGKGFATQTWSNNQIKATADGIRADMTKVEGKIDGLEIGGRNLIKRSDFGNIVISGVSGVAVLAEDYQNGLKGTGGNNGRNNYIEFPDVLSGNGWYTVSFLARGTQGGTRGISVIIGDSPAISDGRISNTSNEYTYHTYSYKVESYNSETNNSIKIAELDYAYYIINNIKLEKGNKATDWSPAPEDTMMENDFNIFKASYEATAQALTSRLTAVDKVGGRLATAETNISQNATAISSKANTSTVNSLTGRVSTAETTITQHATSIASKASQTEVNTVKGTVSGHTTLISQNATAISARLTTAQVNSLVDGKGLSTATYVDNKIKATADSFGVELTKVEGKIPTDYNNENLIGGYNKFKAGGSNSPSLSTSVNSSGNLVIDKVTTSADVSVYSWQMEAWGDISSHFSEMLEDGDLITTSFMIRRLSGTMPSLRVYLSASGMDYTLLIGNVSADWSLVYGTHTYRKDGHIQPHILVMGGPAGKFEIKSWQVERGSVATKHGPSPKDALKLDDFTVFKNSYQSTVNGINTELSKTAKTTDLNGMVTESVLSTKGFVTQGSINTTLSNYLKTTDLNGKVKETVAYQDIKATTDRYTRVIGSTDAESRTKIAQIAMTDSSFQTTVRNSIDVGGTNLYPHSTAPYGINYTYAPDVLTIDGRLCLAYTGDNILALGQIGKDLAVGRIYTFSFYAKASANIGSRSSMHVNGANSPYTNPIPNTTFNYTRTWTRYSATFEVKVTGAGVNVHLYPDQSSTGVFYIADWQLEEGNIVTAHSPAPEDKANQSQVTQLANSWVMNLKNGTDIVTQISATPAGVRIKGNSIHLDGNTLINDAVIKSAHIDTLNANKIVGNTAEFNKIRTGVLTADVVTATHIKADTALFDTLFSTTSATDRLVARGAWIENANIKNLDASKINAGTINAARISTGSLNNVELGGTNLYNGSSYPQRLLDFYPKATATYAIAEWSGGLTKNCVYWTGENTVALPALNKDLVVGKIYTLSFYARTNKTSATSSNNIYINGSNSIPNSAITYSNAWKRYKYTFKVAGSGTGVRVHLYPNIGSGNHFYLADFQLEEGAIMSAYSPAPEDDVTDLARVTGRVEIHGGNIKADTLDVRAITGDKATFISAGFKALNSQSTINGNAIRIQNTSGEFVEMNNTPELRSDDAGGTSVVLGKGRVHFYDSRGHSKGYVGVDMHTAGSNDFGTFLSKGSGIYKFARMADATQATYAYYTIKAGITSPSGIITNMVQNGYLPDGNAQQFVTKGNMLSQLNGWSNYPNWPALSAGQQIRYKELTSQTVGNAYEDIWKFGPSTNGDWRIYFAKHATFEGGTTGASDRRLKHDIEPTQVEALHHIESLAFKGFRWNRDNKHEPLGLIAQDSGIIRVSDDDMEGIDIQRAIMLGLKGVQELQEIVKEQAEEIRQLKEINNQ